MKTNVLLLTILFIASCSTSESDRFREALSVDDATQRATALQDFIAQYPAGEHASSARSKLVDAWVEAKNETGAIAAARLYLDSLSGRRYVSGVANVANEFASKGLALDTAMAWAVAIEPVADTTSRYYWATARNAQALILMHRGDIGRALELQRSVVERVDDEFEFIRNLAVLESKSGMTITALSRVALPAIDGDGESLDYFLTWKEALPDDRRKTVTDSIAVVKARYFVDSLHSDDKQLAQSTASVFLARCGSALELAESWSADPLSSGDLTASDEIVYRKNRACVLAALGKEQEALDMFGSIADVMDPWYPDDLITYGRLLESVTKNRDALNLYATGMLADDGEKIKNAFLSAYTKEFGSSKGARAYVENWRDALENFKPPRRTPEQSSKIVLAELFTGSECNPCISADLAFDELADYYGRSELAILEYHLHIPRPDPMTNNDGWNRYQFYGGNFGTPTIIVDGADKTIGGGPKFVKRNRFFFFDRMIRRHLPENPSLTLDVRAVLKGNVVEAVADMRSSESGHFLVNMALVEKRVHYTGGNGVTEHRFVVRAVSDSGMAGTSTVGPSTTHTWNFNLSDIEDRVQAQIDKPHEQLSWGSRKQIKPEWKNTPPPLNREGLAVVVWIQDPTTREVLQSGYYDLKN